jgi:tripartite-type tricarboxylate transporter receptor subunit TctC
MKRLGLILLSVALAIGITSASAQEKYPDRPIRILVPYGPGGATDIAARVLANEMTNLTGQSVLVINKPGAFGLLAIDEMAKSTPDGYTLMVGNVSTNAITPIIYASKLSVNYEKDVIAISNLIDVPAFLLSTATDFPPATAAELIAWAKKNPGKLRFATVGVGSYPHYDMAYFAKRAGNLEMSDLPNKNGAPGALQDMVRGDAQMAFLNVGSSAGMVQAGKLRALAVVNHTRLEAYPNVPTMKEVGYADVGTIAWNALFAPAATPKPIQEALFKIVAKAMQSPDLIDKFKKQNFNVVPSKSLGEAKTWLAGEMKHWTTITNAVKIEAPQ